MLLTVITQIELSFHYKNLVFVCNFFVYYSHRVIGVYILLRHSHNLVYLQLSKRSIFITGHVRAVINLGFNHACETAQSRAIFIYLYH